MALPGLPPLAWNLFALTPIKRMVLCHDPAQVHPLTRSPTTAQNPSLPELVLFFIHIFTAAFIQVDSFVFFCQAKM